MFVTRGGRIYNLLILVVAVGANRIRPVLYSHWIVLRLRPWLLSLFPILRPMLPTLFSWDCVPDYHRCAQYCLPGREKCWVIACLKPESWNLNPETTQHNHETQSRDNIVAPRDCVICYHRCCPETLSQATIAMLSTAFQAGKNVG